MDEKVIKFYRNLLRTNFEHAGSIENSSIFLDTTNEVNKSGLCGNMGEFMQLYVKVSNDTIEDIKYNCICDPTANVAVEILCSLIKGKTLDEAADLSEKEFSRYLGTEGPELQKKSRGLLDLLNKGITRFRK